MGRDLPSGTVTFLFTDVEGSTKLLHALGAEAYAEALAEHRRLLRNAFARHGGVEVDTQGDAFFVAFPTAPGAMAAAREATEALATGPIRVRIGLHTGTPHLTDEGYVGADVHRAARIAAVGHGGQILVSAATAALLDATEGLRDLGLHRLKDLSAAERIFQADPDEHPPLQTLHQANLPVPVTPFLGREAELAELAALLTRDDVRLVTLTGPGGTGKTRLALAAAGGLAERYPDGVWWVPLAALRDPDLVLESAARTVGAPGDIAEHVADKRLLLLLDNFEHLMPAADGLAPLLARCPNLTLLVTSRGPLHLAAEHEYAVDPLRRNEAVELFMTRALAARRDVTANGEVAAICERLDHLPLAIELAAARVKVLSPRALLERLEQRLPVLAGGARDLPERQRTLRATIEWSHELLTDDERRLFARLSVFRGGWTMEAAETVADSDLDTLQSLVDKSLVRIRDERFWMLETIREYAAERLDSLGEADSLRRRHADHFLSVAEEAEPRILHDDLEWLDRLEADHDNLRAALDTFDATQQHGAGLRMAAALWRFWYQKSHFAEGLRRLTAAAKGEPRTTLARATAYRGSSVMAFNLGDLDAGRRFAEQAIELDRELGHEWGVAYSLMMIGNCLDEAREDLPTARERMAESAALFEKLGDRHYALIATHNRAQIGRELGDVEAAKRLYEETLVTAREIGNAALEADALAKLGMEARDEGRLADAVALLQQSIRIDHRRGMVVAVAKELGGLASVLVRQGDADSAARLLGAEEGLTERLGGQLPWRYRRRRQETEALLVELMDAGSLERVLAEGRAMSADEAVALALGQIE